MSTTGHRVSRLDAHLRHHKHDFPAKVARFRLASLFAPRNRLREKPITEKIARRLREEETV